MKEAGIWKSVRFRLLTVLFYTVLLAGLFFPYSFYLIKGLATHSLSASEVFLYDHDWIQQGIPYYREFFRCIESGTLHWSWNEFLGTPFYATKATYVIGDPFAWLTYGLYKTAFHYLPTALFAVTGLKLLVAGLGFEVLLERISKQKAAALVFGACYMMSGWAVIFLEQVYFLSFYAILPFILLGLEAILNEKGHYLFFASILLALTTNLYLSWSLCFFLLAYWLVRAIGTGKTGKELLKRTGSVLITFTCAFLSAMVVLLPGILVLLNSPRLNGNLIDYTFWSWTNIRAILLNLFVPVIGGENLLYHDYWYYFYQIGIYCGALALLVIPQLFVQRRPKEDKVRYGIVLALLVLSLISPKIGILLHLSYSLRYTCYIAIVLLLLAAKAFEQPFHPVTLGISAAVLIAIAAILSFGCSGLAPSELVQYPEAILLWVSMGLILLYTTGLALESTWKTGRLAVLGLAVIEVLVFSNVTIRTKTTQRTPAEYLYQDQQVTETYARLHEDDPSFFRVNLLEGVQADPSVLPNTSMYYGIPALSGYDSVYCSALHDYLAWQGLYPDVSWNFRINDSRMDGILNAKYTIVTPTTAPLVSKTARLLTEYSSDVLFVYRNANAAGAAVTVNTFLPESQMREWMQDIEGNRNRMVNALQKYTIIDDKSYSAWGTGYTSIKQKGFDGFQDGTKLTFKLTLETQSPVRFSIPADKGWKMRIDDVETDWQVCDGGFILAIVPEGPHTVEFTYHTPGFGAGLVLSIAGLAAAIIWLSGKGGMHAMREV